MAGEESLRSGAWFHVEQVNRVHDVGEDKIQLA